MRNFEDLFLQTRVQNITKRGEAFQLFLPRFNEAGNQRSLNITVLETSLGSSKYTNRPTLGFEHHRNIPFMAEKGSPVIQVDLSSLVSDNYHSLTLSVEYTDPHGKSKNLDDTYLYHAARNN